MGALLAGGRPFSSVFAFTGMHAVYVRLVSSMPFLQNTNISRSCSFSKIGVRDVAVTSIRNKRKEHNVVRSVFLHTEYVLVRETCLAVVFSVRVSDPHSGLEAT